MLEPNDAIYEIVATDAWRSIISTLRTYRDQFKENAIQEASKVDAQLHKITRAAGHVQAVDAILERFTQFGEKRGG
jgi:uncharacterized protein (DUF2267 family)